MEIFIIILLSVAVYVLLSKLLYLKKRLRYVSRQLDDSENRLITTELNGDELEKAIEKINLMIEKNQQAKMEIIKEQVALKQAISDISHDIRTPLTSVVGYLQLAERDVVSEEQRCNISIALERAQYCTALVNDLFELSLIDSKEWNPFMEKINVNDILCELILANYSNFEAKQVMPHFEDSGKPVYALADKKMLTRVIQNLISNGIKYGISQLDFTLGCDEQVHLSVSNPIREHEIDTERIFDKFYQTSKARNANGAGIGLYICKKFVELMNGSIRANVEEERLIVNVTLNKY